MIGSKRDPEPVSILLLQKRQEFADLAIQSQSHGVHLRRIRSVCVPSQVACRQTEHQQVGDSSLAELFLLNEFAGKLELIIISVGSAANQFEIIDGLAVWSVVWGGRAEHFAVGVFPIEIQVLLCVLLAVERGQPVWR